MLKIKGLDKIYKSKKGEEVKALTQVNLEFPEKGMIFILGKSGSGKSTLLNILGGLDNYDAGEIIINGKSSKDFKQADLDSYRNTYLGFIFQEFNLLDNFSVFDNIGIALELQHEKPSTDKINDVLKKVDLEGLGNRKPNELSGGQRQRVAIARTLIKNPKIILADEPTGSLDSETGISILKTLKELSKDKLVIIVSHDRELSENYADRIIEFKDGTVISDTTKENNKFVNTKNKEIILDNNDNLELKKSKLGFKNSFKFAFSNLKIKPIRLIMTILLSFISFTLFGVADTMGNYDKITATIDSLNASDLSVTSYEKVKQIKDGSTINEHIVKFTDDDLSVFEQNTNIDILPIYNMYNNQNFNNVLNFYKTIDTTYYNTLFFTASSITDKMYNQFGYELHGVLPRNKNEVVITKYTLELFIDCGLLQDNVEHVITDVNDIIGKQISVYNTDLSTNEYSTVVGVLDTNFNSTKYNFLKEETNNSSIGVEFNHVLKTGLHNNVFVHEDLLPKSNPNSFDILGSVQQTINGVSINSSFDTITTELNDSYFVDENKTTLENNEVLIPEYNFKELFVNEIQVYKNNIYTNGGTTIIENYISTLSNEEVLRALHWSDDYDDYEFARAQLLQSICMNFDNTLPGIKSGLCIIVEAGALNNLTANMTLNYFNDYTSDYDKVEMNVVGFYKTNNDYDYSIVTTKTLFDEIALNVDTGLIEFIASSIPTDDILKELVEYCYEYNNGIKYKMNNPIQLNVDNVNGSIESLTMLFLGVGVFFALFSSVLLFNFISISIASKKREIGILRALGSRSKDIFNIFFIETIVIGLINFILSIILLFILSTFLNSYLSEEIGLGIILLHPSIRQIGLIFIITLLVSFISSFFPVYKIAIKRPIESIKKG